MLQTIVYFDLFDYPLTSWETYQLLYVEKDIESSYAELKDLLTTSELLQERLFFKDGFFGIRGREEVVAIRQKRQRISHRKYHIARRFVRIARHVPFINLIAVCNNLAFHNAKEKSDLDFFIVTKKYMMPFVRFFLVLISIIFFKRPDSSHHKDTICLSFLVDEAHTDISSMSLSGGDSYLLYWLATLQPLYLRDRTAYDAFIASNQNFLHVLPNLSSRVSTSQTIIGESVIARAGVFLGTVLHAAQNLSGLLYAFQLRKLPKGIREKMNTSTSVIISEGIFKTHTADKRGEIHAQWIQASSR